MHFRIQIVISEDDSTEQPQVIADIPRAAATLDTLGLTVAESTHLLEQLQRIMVDQQVAAYLAQQRACPTCGKNRQLKQGDTAPFRTLFGLVQLPTPRGYHCECQPQAAKTVRPLTALLPERSSPELRYRETKWAALASYGITTTLLHDVLPIDQPQSAVTVRNHVFAAARRSEQAMGEELAMGAAGCQAERNQLPIPDGPLAVGRDGGIVRARRGTLDAKTGNLFEVIAGKSIVSFRRDDPEGVPPSRTCFALVRACDTKPKRRLWDVLQAQGMQANQQVTFFSDGGATVRLLPRYLHPEAEHLLDWFHITMKSTVLQQCTRGIAQPKVSERAADGADEERLERRLERSKQYLWHGNSAKALERLQVLEATLACWGCDEVGDRPASGVADSVTRMRKYVQELTTYITNNASCIVNYGERYRNGARISTAFVESTINHVVSKRMVKQQQMQWTPEGAHLLLQVRVQVINEDWEATFRRWYPNVRPVQPGGAAQALAA